MSTILDNHLHLDFNGRNVYAVKDFIRAGGTHLILVHKPYASVKVRRGGDFKNAYEITLKLAELVMKETEAKVFTVLGPHPAELTKLAENIGLEEAKYAMIKGIDIAGRYAEDCVSVGIGEVGRPHYKVSKDVWETSNEILRYAMSVARDVDCPIILHTEDASISTFKEIAEIADAVGLRREKVVKHFSPPIVDVDENHGLFPSILASKDSVKKAIKKGRRFLLETDYIDDQSRPGAVLGPKTVPRVTKMCLKEGLLTEDDVIKIHKEYPERIYGIEIE